MRKSHFFIALILAVIIPFIICTEIEHIHAWQKINQMEKDIQILEWENETLKGTLELERMNNYAK